MVGRLAGCTLRALQAYSPLCTRHLPPATCTISLLTMNPFLFCPYCATPLQTRLLFGKERPACNACGFVQFQDPKVAASALLTEGDHVLLICRGVPPRKGLLGDAGRVRGGG